MKNQIERAEPSRDSRQNTVDKFAETIVSRLRVQKFYEEWRNSKAAKAEFDYVEREGFCECEWAFAEAYARAGYVVLLEALRTCVEWEADYRARNHLGQNAPHPFKQAEAAIKQAEPCDECEWPIVRAIKQAERT